MSSELLKKIETSSGTLESNIELIDIKLQNTFVSTGKIRLYNVDGELDGVYSEGDDIEVSMSWNQDGEQEPEKIFTGYITKVEEEAILRLEVKTPGGRMQESNFKKSYNKAKASRIINDIMDVQDIEIIKGALNNIEKHTFICPGDVNLIEQINRVNDSFGLELIPHFDRDGKLILKTLDELLTPTDYEFKDEEFASFENGILETILDVDIKLFNELTVLDVPYYVTSHQFYSDDKRTKSFIGLDSV